MSSFGWDLVGPKAAECQRTNMKHNLWLMSQTQYTLICTNTHLSMIVTQGCTQPSIQVYILEPTEQVPEKAFWLTSKLGALKLHGYLPSESRRASFQMKQLLKCKQLQYLAKSNSQNYQKPARYGMCFAIVMVCPGHSWSLGRLVSVWRSFTVSLQVWVHSRLLKWSGLHLTGLTKTSEISW